jgi:hypothetical protein
LETTKKDINETPAERDTKYKAWVERFKSHLMILADVAIEAIDAWYARRPCK